MDSSLTVYGVGKHLSVDHPVGHVEDVAGQAPRRLLIWVEDGLPSYTKTHQHHQHDNHEVQHVDHLETCGNTRHLTQYIIPRYQYITVLLNVRL